MVFGIHGVVGYLVRLAVEERYKKDTGHAIFQIQTIQAITAELMDQILLNLDLVIHFHVQVSKTAILDNFMTFQ